MGSAAPPCPALFNFHLRSKTFLHRNKSVSGISRSYCCEAEITFVNSVQYCNSVCEVFLKKHITPEKKASLCAGLTTVHHKLFWLFSGFLSLFNSIFFPVHFSSFLLLLPPFSFLLGVWVSV